MYSLLKSIGELNWNLTIFFFWSKGNFIRNGQSPKSKGKYNRHNIILAIVNLHAVSLSILTSFHRHAADRTLTQKA